jgi:hypothetical protein
VQGVGERLVASIFNEVGELAPHIADRFKPGAVIGIDGWTGVGKTTLALALARATGGAMFDIDDALVRDRKCFAPALQLDVIRDGLAEPKGLLFVSGICLRQVLELVGCEADAHIYMKRMAMWGWADEDELSGTLPEVPGASGEAPRREMRLYHEQWQPHLRADYEYHRLD